MNSNTGARREHSDEKQYVGTYMLSFADAFRATIEPFRFTMDNNETHVYSELGQQTGCEFLEYTECSPGHTAECNPAKLEHCCERI